VYDLPFFEQAHRELARDLSAWADAHVGSEVADEAEGVRNCVRELGASRFLRFAVPAPYGVHEPLDLRSVCIARETLAYRSSLADFAFAMQGLGSAAIARFGTRAQRDCYLPGVVAGEAIAAFAISEPDAGSDVSALRTRAHRRNGHYVIDGTKAWISNAGIAQFYTVFARTSDDGARGITAFVVDADAGGLRVGPRMETLASHPLAALEFDDCRVALSSRIGEEGQGFKIAMSVLDFFRPSVAAAAVGFARRAYDEIDFAAPESGAVEATFSLSQALWKKVGAGPVRLLSFDLLQDVLLWAQGSRARLSETSGNFGASLGPVGLSAGARYDWSVRKLSSIGASATARDGRTDEVHSSFNFLRGSSSARPNRSTPPRTRSHPPATAPSAPAGQESLPSRR